MVLIIDYDDNSVDDIRTGAVLIQPSAEFKDEHIERILHEYIEAEVNNEALPEPVLWPTQDPESSPGQYQMF